MPLSRRTLTEVGVTRVCEAMFEPSTPDSFGVELEWPLHRVEDVTARPSDEQVTALEGTILQCGSRVTFEPGGQIELSTARAASVTGALSAAEVDTQMLHARLATMGLQPETLAVDQRRSPQRVLQRPRYAAMEEFFDRQGSAGSWMMCNTASTQVNISHDTLDPLARWATLHHIGPVLIAAFANSPGLDASARRWRSLRHAIWWSIDPARTRPVPIDVRPPLAWRDYALRADVLFIRRHDDGDSSGTTPGSGLSFGRWMSQGHAAGWPTIEDFRYHLTTLFPPVRPRGWLELRVLDALPGWIRDCASVVVAAACSSDARQELAARLPDTSGLWLTAARDGLDDPILGSGARTLLDVALEHLASVTVDSRLIAQLEDFTEGYVRRRRCPGDDPAASSDRGRQHETVRKAPYLSCA
jgi:glutamate--cysteine ligase